MNNLTFEMLSQGWNAIRMGGAPNLRKLVSGFIDPAHIILQRVGETPDTLTVMFKGFDQGLDNPEQDAPILKRAILAWVKNFAEAQIERSGDPMSFIIRLVKTQQMPAATPQVAENKKSTKIINGPLVNISNVRKIDGR